MKRRKLFFSEGEHFYSVDSQLSWLNLKKQNWMSRGVGYLILVTATPQDIFRSKAKTSSCHSEKQQKELGGGSLGTRMESRWDLQDPMSLQFTTKRHTVVGQIPGLTSSAPEVSHL